MENRFVLEILIEISIREDRNIGSIFRQNINKNKN